MSSFLQQRYSAIVLSLLFQINSSLRASGHPCSCCDQKCLVKIIDEVESQVRIVTIGEETSWQEKWNAPGTKSDQNSTNRAKVSRSEAFPARIVFSEQHFAEIYRRKFASPNQAPDGHGELPQFSFAFHPLNSQFRLRSIKLKMNLNHFLDVTHNVKQTF